MKSSYLLTTLGIVIVAASQLPEAFGAVIVGESAETSSFQPGRTASDAVDNSGITVNGTNLALDGDFEHNNTNTDMWQTLNAQPDGSALNQTLTIDLGQPYNVDGMRVWNYNELNGTDTAIAAYDLATSLDGVTFTPQQTNQALAQAPSNGANGYDGVYTAVNWTNSRYVRIKITDTYRTPSPLDDTAGLSEVMFSGNQSTSIIFGEIATATSEQGIRIGAKAVNNSGITWNGLNLANDGDIEHDSAVANMWQTENGLGDNAALGESLTIDLLHGDGNLPLYNVSGMRIWNFNEASGGTDTGIALYDLETSPNGSTWTLQQDDQSLAPAPGTGFDGYDGVYTAVNWAGIRYVRITVRDTYRSNDDIAGLSEVMFIGVPVPEPGSMFLLACGGFGLLATARRRTTQRV